MGDVPSRQTVLFVSHNMSAMMQLCPTSFTLRNGQLIAQGPTREIVQQYLTSLFESNGPDLEHVLAQ